MKRKEEICVINSKARKKIIVFFRFTFGFSNRIWTEIKTELQLKNSATYSFEGHAQKWHLERSLEDYCFSVFYISAWCLYRNDTIAWFPLVSKKHTTTSVSLRYFFCWDIYSLFMFEYLLFSFQNSWLLMKPDGDLTFVKEFKILFLTHICYFLLVLSACLSHPCLHGGTCIDTYFLHNDMNAVDLYSSPSVIDSQQNAMAYICKCIAPFAGRNCEGTM